MSILAGQCETLKVPEDYSPQIYAFCRRLLQFGPSKAVHMQPALLTLSNVSQGLSAILQNRDLVGKTPNIVTRLVQLLSCLSNITGRLQIRCQEMVDGPRQSPKDPAANPLLRKHVGEFHYERDQIVDQLWSLNLPSSIDQEKPAVAVAETRQWLKPHDRLIQVVYQDVLATMSVRAEFTCEWFFQPLLDFIRSSDKIYWVEGPMGFGKSVLYTWTLETLQRPIGAQTYNVISYSADPLFPTEATICSLIKSLLLQVLDQNIAQSRMFDTFSKLLDIMQIASDAVEVESMLMETLAFSLQNTAKPLMIVIDGFNHLDCSSDMTSELLNWFFKSLSATQTVRMIMFSRPLGFLPEALTHRLTIESSHVQADIRQVMEGFRPPVPREAVQDITERAQGNFLWPVFAFQYLTAYHGHDGSTTSSRIIPQSLNTVIKQLVATTGPAQKVAQMILNTCAIALRPQRVEEIESLARLDIGSSSFTRQTMDVLPVIERDCRNLLTVQDGLVCFRHQLIRDLWLPSASEDKSTSLTELHSDTTQRLLLYLKTIQGEQSDLSFNLVSPQVIDQAVRSQPLLDYAIRYWTTHYARSTASDLIDLSGSSSVSRFVFPESVYFANFEVSYWAARPAHEFLPIIAFSRETSKEILGDHQVILQSTTSLAKALLGVLRFTEAANNFTLAFELAQKMLPEFHSFTVACVSNFLDTFEALPDLERTEYTTTKSNMLQYMVELHDQQFGPSSDLSATSRQRLWQHYASTSQEARAAQILRYLYSLNVDRYGRSSPQAKATAKDLMTVLRRTEEQQDELLLDDSVFDDIVESFDVTDPHRVKALITKAQSCVSRSDLVDAELMYATLWHDVTCRGKQGHEKDEQELEVGLVYSRFLSQNNRLAEAQSVLLSLWGRHEDSHQRSQSGNNLIKEVAVELQQSGLLETALQVSNSARDWVNANIPDSNELEEIEHLVAHNVSLIATSVRSEPTLSKSIESSLLRLLESKFVPGSSSLDASTVKLGQSLINKYHQEQRWQDLIWICSISLRFALPFLLDEDSDPSELRTLDKVDPELGEMAFTLAHAYENTNQNADAARIYMNIFLAATRSVGSYATWVERSFKAAVSIYQKMGQVDQLMEIQRELLVYYLARYGEGHEQTVHTLYELASLCMEYQDTQNAVYYYSRLANIFQRNDYHEEIALPALDALLAIYRNQQSWTDLEKVYRSIWMTFLNKGSDYGMSKVDARKLYSQYAQLLRLQLSADPSALRNLAEEYRYGCASTFGERDLFTIEAASLLATVWDEDCQDEIEAARIYEWVLQEAPNPPYLSDDTTSIIAHAEQFMTNFYRERAKNDMDEQTLNRATELQKKAYQKANQAYGDSHPASLSDLAIWVSFLRKQDSQQSRHAISHALRRTFDAIAISNAEPAHLYQAAVLLASLFLTNGQKEEGSKLAQDLHRRAFPQEESANRSLSYHPDDTLERSAFIFLTAFETRLSGSMLSAGENHSKAIVESMLWRNYHTLRASGAKPELAMVCGAKLHNLLMSHESTTQSKLLEQQLFDDFIAVYGSAFTTSADKTRKFFLVLLEDIGAGRLQVDIPRSACFSLNNKVKELLRHHQCATIADMALPGFQFIQYVNAYLNVHYMETGLDLALMLASKPGQITSDRTQGSQMFAIGKIVLREAIKYCREQDFDLTIMELGYLSRVASVLGLQQNYEDLEVGRKPSMINSAQTNILAVAPHSTVAWSPRSQGCYSRRDDYSRSPPCRGSLFPWSC